MSQPNYDDTLQTDPAEMRAESDELLELSEELRRTSELAGAIIIDIGGFGELLSRGGADDAYADLQQQMTTLSEAGAQSLADLGRALREAAEGYQAEDQDASGRMNVYDR